jgi:rhamnulokinase
MTGIRRFGVLDVGASGGRALVASTDGQSVTLEEVHRFDNGPVSVAGYTFWDILSIWQGVGAGIQRLHAAAPDLESIAIDTWGCDFGVIDAGGRLVGNPFTYRDPARRASIESVTAVIGDDELFERVGAPLDSIMSIYQLKAMVDSRSAEAVSGANFLMIPDLLVYFLTGERINEFTNATMALLADQRTRSWDRELIERLGIPSSWFADPVEPGTPVGSISEEVATALGVPRIPVIVPASHDTASAVAGLPVHSSSAAGSWAFVSLGTWVVCGFESPVPRTTPDVRAAGFGNEGGVDGNTIIVRNLVGLWIIQECRKVWEREFGDVTWERVLDTSDVAAAFTHFIDIDDPRFGAVVPDMPQLIRDYCAETGQPVPGGMGEVARCAYESLVMKLRERVADMERISGTRLETLHVVGGGIQNTQLCQWIADATGMDVVAGPVETTSVGNALMQMWAAGVVGSLSEARDLSHRSFELTNYQPSNTATWDSAYESYAAVINR